ncbi:hypothetical protein [Campylobacter showae]|jgi:hypothetical protein|uniref:Uncharacterized protein n=1 Tax=Campylobacter showae CC57C TaxID=1073353 RepID=M3I340_9BACT|nr:hypothetical protein [Campylobacter showae]EMG31019.1 hypothetical protein H740_03442 [Campylobacter showae CC57C]
MKKFIVALSLLTGTLFANGNVGYISTAVDDAFHYEDGKKEVNSEIGFVLCTDRAKTPYCIVSKGGVNWDDIEALVAKNGETFKDEYDLSPDDYTMTWRGVIVGWYAMYGRHYDGRTEDTATSLKYRTGRIIAPSDLMFVHKNKVNEVVAIEADGVKMSIDKYLETYLMSNKRSSVMDAVNEAADEVAKENTQRQQYEVEQATEPVIELKVGNYVEVLTRASLATLIITAVDNDVSINSIILNRGNCSVQDKIGNIFTGKFEKVFPMKMQYGQQRKLGTYCQNIKEVVIETNKGTWTFTVND